MRAAWWFLTGWFIAFSATATVAAAQEPPSAAKPTPEPGWGGPRPPPRDAELAPLPPPPEGEKRAPQDYDGREDVTSAAEDALWIPRVLFFPLFVVSEYLVRAPLGAVIKGAESEGAADLPTRIGVAPSLF